MIDPVINHNNSGGQQLRVLVLASLFPNRFRPGQAAFNQQQFRALVGLCQLGLVAPVPFTHVLPPRRRQKEPPSFPFPVSRPIYWYLPRWARHLHGRFFFCSAWPSLARMSRNLRPQVLMANWLYPDGWAGLRAARRLGLPLVVQVLGSDLMLMGKDPKRLPLLRQTLLSAQAVMTVSSALKQEAIRLGASEEKVFVVENGVDQETFHPQDRAEARRRLGLSPDRSVVLFVGNLVPVKGLSVALQALSLLSDVDLVVMGEGPLEAALRKQAVELGLTGRVTWSGQVDHRQVADYMAACNALVLPSFSEGQPNVVLEALSSGRPVAASDVGGVTELVKEGEQGALVPPGDHQALARAVSKVLEKNWDARALHASVAGRSWEASAGGLLKVLEFAAREGGSI